MTDRKLDPATFEVVKNSLLKIAEEMKIVLAKTAYSPILKVAGDYSCGVFDIQGNMVAQGPDLPIHLGSMPDAVRAIVQVFGDDVADGDVFIHNDPYFGGSHLPDVNVITPAFHEGALLGYCCVRTPDERIGDLRAQVAANRRACQRLGALAAKHGAGGLKAIMAEVMDYSERMMRLMLEKMPDGEARFEDFCDGDGIIEDGDTDDKIFWVRMRIKKSGDSITVDFDGTDPKVSGPMNAPLSVTASGVYAALKMVIDPNSLIPPNSGAWRPISVTAPEGSCVNATFPAPVVYANHEMSHRICDMTFGALAQFMPESVMACSQGTSAIVNFGGQDPRDGNRYVSYETIKGGSGARFGKDGINTVAAGISNTMNTPIEVLEMSFPLRVDYYEILADSGGLGKWRGGCGARRAWTVVDHDARGTVCFERTRSAPFGICGGEAGAPARIKLKLPDGSERDLVSKGAFDAPAGCQVIIEAPGGGGYGAKNDRDPDAHAADAKDHYVS